MAQKLQTEVNFYQLLGIDRKAGADEVKKAYRTLAKKYHPDINKDPQAANVFRNIKSAYEILSDPYRRKVYDYLLFRKEHSPDTQAYQRRRNQPRTYEQYKARKRAEARRRQEETETFVDVLNFHFKQAIGLVISLVIFGAGIGLLVLGLNFLFIYDFNGSLVAGYFTTASGLGLIYGMINAFKTLALIWYHWFEKRQQVKN